MNLYVGTSGFSYKEWKGGFYPPDLPGRRMLEYYAQHFRTVEINNTFYRMPAPALLETWADQVPADFRFVLKAPAQITHVRRLKNCEQPVERLMEVSAVLGERLGPVLFQLPPNLKKDIPRLRDFLAIVPTRCRVSLEFRHESWFDDETFQLLRERNAAMCVAQAEGDLEVPFVPTADWGYLRLRLVDYSPAELKAWRKRVESAKWKEAFVFFKHEEEAKGPKLARRFMELFEGAPAR